MKYVSMCVTVVLLVAALIFAPATDSVSKDVKVGKGKGVSESLESVEDVIGFLRFLSPKNEEEVLMENVRLVYSLSASNDISNVVQVLAKEDVKAEKSQKEYTSGTWSEKAFYKKMYEYGEDGKYTYSATTLLTSYMTETKSYYILQATVISSEGNNYVFDAEVYQDEKQVLVKYNRFDSFMQISNGFFGKWIDASNALYDFHDIDSFIRGYLETMCECLEKYCLADSKELAEAEVERIQTDDKVRLVGDGINVVVDLKNGKAPMITCSYSNASEGSSEFLMLIYSFENINNTIVAFDYDVEIYDMNDMKVYIKG